MMAKVKMSFHETVSTTLSVKVSDWVRARPPVPQISKLNCSIISISKFFKE